MKSEDSLGHFPLDQKFHNKFLDITSGEWHLQPLPEFQKSGQPHEVNSNCQEFITKNFCSIKFLSRYFQNFRLLVNGFHFGNSTTLGFSQKLSQEISTPLFCRCFEFLFAWNVLQIPENYHGSKSTKDNKPSRPAMNRNVPVLPEIGNIW